MRRGIGYGVSHFAMEPYNQSFRKRLSDWKSILFTVNSKFKYNQMWLFDNAN